VDVVDVDELDIFVVLLSSSRREKTFIFEEAIIQELYKSIKEDKSVE
jgi:hypothetical protein